MINVGLSVGTYQRFQILIPSNQWVEYCRNRSLRFKLNLNHEVIKVFRNRHIIFDCILTAILCPNSHDIKYIFNRMLRCLTLHAYQTPNIQFPLNAQCFHHTVDRIILYTLRYIPGLFDFKSKHVPTCNNLLYFVLCDAIAFKDIGLFCIYEPIFLFKVKYTNR